MMPPSGAGSPRSSIPKSTMMARKCERSTIGRRVRRSIGVAHHAEGAPHHRAEQPDKQKNGEGIVVEVGEERLLENIGEDDASDPRNGRPKGGDERAPVLASARLPARRSRACSSRLPSPRPAPDSACPRANDEAKLSRRRYAARLTRHLSPRLAVLRGFM
jgi:hypothetical protein